MIDQPEVILRIEDVQILAYQLIGKVTPSKANHLIEDGKRITHSSVRLLSNQVQCLRLSLITFFLSDILQVLNGSLYGHTLEVVNLTTAEDGWKNLVLLCGGQDKDDIRRWLFKSFEECIESGTAEHVNFINDEHLVLAYLRGNLYLFYQFADIFHRVVAGSVQFVNAHGALLVKSATTLTLATCLTIFFRVETIDGLCKDAGTGSFTHTARTAEKVCMSQFARADGIL